MSYLETPLLQLRFFFEEASDGILDVFRFDSGFQVGDLDLDPGDEMSNRPPGSNYLFNQLTVATMASSMYL